MSTFYLHSGDRSRDAIRANAHKLIDALDVAKSWTVKVARYVKARSDRQNHALFGVAYPALTKDTGFDTDEMHDVFCKRFFGKVEREVFGELQSKPFRTTTTDEHGKRDVIAAEDFARFYEMVQRVGAESGCHVPDPDPMLRRA